MESEAVNALMVSKPKEGGQSMIKSYLSRNSAKVAKILLADHDQSFLFQLLLN